MSEALSQLRAAEAELEAAGPLPFPLPLGGLAPVVAGAFGGMQTSDWVVVGPRERLGAVLRGCPVSRLVDPRAGARPYKLAPVSDAPGSRALHAVGLALGSGGPVLCMLGLASAASGAFHEAMNAAVLTGARVVFLLSTRELGDDAPVGRQLAASPVALAEAHGLWTVSCEASEEAVREAVAAARTAEGPSLVHVRLG